MVVTLELLKDSPRDSRKETQMARPKVLKWDQ
jgi:hypothetical protein